MDRHKSHGRAMCLYSTNQRYTMRMCACTLLLKLGLLGGITDILVIIRVL